MTITIQENTYVLTEAIRRTVRGLRGSLHRRPERWHVSINTWTGGAGPALNDRAHLVVVGPIGVTVCEVRRGDDAFLQGATFAIDDAAQRARWKANRLKAIIDATGVRAHLQPVLVVDALPDSDCPTIIDQVPVVRSNELGNWLAARSARAVPEGRRLTVPAVHRVGEFLAVNGDSCPAPRVGVADLLGPEDLSELPYHAAYRGQLTTGRATVVHVHDLTAGNRSELLRLARRGAAVIDALSPSPHVPDIDQHFQIYPDEEGDFAWFAVRGTAYPTLRERAADQAWSLDRRITFAVNAFRALDRIQSPDVIGVNQVIFRRLNPTTICVTPEDEPFFRDFRFARDAARATRSDSIVQHEESDELVAPEVRLRGLSAASRASDIYSLSASLKILFTSVTTLSETDSTRVDVAIDMLNGGCDDDAVFRSTAPELAEELKGLRTDYPGLIEEEIEDFTNEYDTVRDIGHGGLGRTILVRDRPIEGDDDRPLTVFSDESDCYVAKLPIDEDDGHKMALAHRTVRPFTRGSDHLAQVLVAPRRWKPGQIVTLVEYVQGSALKDAAPAMRTDLLGTDPGRVTEVCALWLRHILSGLSQLHRHRVVHGDVSPDNAMLRDGKVVVIDYDAALREGQLCTFRRMTYASPERLAPGAVARCSDDVYEAAASIVECLTGITPILGTSARTREAVEAQGKPYEFNAIFEPLRRVLNRATHHDPSARYRDALEALDDLNRGLGPNPIPPWEPNPIQWPPDLRSIMASALEARRPEAPQAFAFDRAYSALTFDPAEKTSRVLPDVGDLASPTETTGGLPSWARTLRRRARTQRVTPRSSAVKPPTSRGDRMPAVADPIDFERYFEQVEALLSKSNEWTTP